MIFNVDSTELLQNYVSALTNLVSIERAKYAADASEQVILRELSSLNRNNGVYVTPGDITQEAGDRIIKESVSAHLTKVQSEQIVQAASDEVERLEGETKKKFLGRKITVLVNDANLDIVDQVLINKKTNDYRVSKYTAKKIKGTIENISFKDNLLVIKPTFSARLIVPNRILVNIYVINLEDMTANISVQ